MSEKKNETKNQIASKGQWHGGKGSLQKDHDHNKFADNWDKIFGKKEKNDNALCLCIKFT